VQDTERPLAEILRHQDARVRRAVARALSRLDSVFAFDALVRALTDESATVRLEAVSGLMLRRSAKAGGTLAKAIDDESDTEVQFAILAALGRVGSRSRRKRRADSSSRKRIADFASPPCRRLVKPARPVR
jgi:HEAT repeat protein